MIDFLSNSNRSLTMWVLNNNKIYDASFQSHYSVLCVPKRCQKEFSISCDSLFLMWLAISLIIASFQYYDIY